jgi:TPR repeat protein
MGMNRTFKAAVAALVFAFSSAGSVAAGPVEDAAFAAAVAEVLADRKALAAYEKGDYAEALRLWRPLAEQGNSDAQSILGVMYEKGQGVLRDYATAVSWYLKAAAQGYSEAQSNLQAMLDKGFAAYNQGDHAEALRLWRPLAEQGYLWAQAALGEMYAKDQDYATAASWYRKAAEQGNAFAQNNLGLMYAHGKGVPQDYAAAMGWWRKAAAQGDADAQHDLGLMYARGEGVPQDYVTAHMWVNLAAARGHKDAAQNHDKIATRMTPAQIAEAQKLAREWKPK